MDATHKLGEAEIIALLQNPLHKEQGFGALMALYQKQLYFHIRQMLEDHDDTDDALQNTFIKAWRFFDNFRAESSLKTWLWRIATNESLTVLAKRKRRSQSDLKVVENSMSHSEQPARQRCNAGKAGSRHRDAARQAEAGFFDEVLR
jgi:RNA polymerase sigma factor (sigma-70 family)